MPAILIALLFVVPPVVLMAQSLPSADRGTPAAMTDGWDVIFLPLVVLNRHALAAVTDP